MKIVQNDATLAQIEAAEPAVSTWLTANAGSGKTRVLTDRVARLLLHGVDPQKILCLTYTKAAASEMQNRLFKRLGEWAMLQSGQLRDALAELGESSQMGDSDLANARTLFARAIETPGGLKIQTIHSFCAGLLRRFPLEAGVNPQFQEIEDRAAELLRAEIVDDMAVGDDAGFIHMLVSEFTGDKLADLTADIVRNQENLNAVRPWAETASHFGVAPDFTDQDLEDRMFSGDETDMLAELIPALRASSSKPDNAMGAALASIGTLDAKAFPILRSTLLTKTGTPNKRNPTKAVRAKIAYSETEFDEFSARVASVVDLLKTRAAAQKTHVLQQFSNRFIARYQQAKLLRGWLDFDDLILKSRQLLSDPHVAQWVLYRLDGGISHILVDEAQDTSPAQWDVIEKLTQDFTSGQGVHEETRTIFVVGDKKQSIYSFQGADPEEFDRMQLEFQQRLTDVGTPLAERSLEFSFRSSEAILRLVDTVFKGKDTAGFSEGHFHKAFHSDKPGRVDLWPVVEKSDMKEDRHWSDPVDRVAQTHHDLVLARHVADQISDMLDPASPAIIPASKSDDGTFAGRPVRAGDIMILVQRRSKLFHEIIRACKQRDIPIAGSDRLRVGAELAVRDLLSVLAFLATPEDDLALATALKSPLFGWSEKRLFDLAQPRRKGVYLWEALQSSGDDETLAILRDLRRRVDFLRPYDLIERVLTRHNGRALILSRLGAEAEDGIDALLSQALAYERSDVPSLTGFLSWANADDLEIKRQVDSSGNLVRVMTVHGSKGLESPIVILPDCAKRTIRIQDEILKSEFGPVWKTKADQSPEIIKDIIEAKKDAEQRERLRLLYVALTRAESWLIVAASGDLADDGSDWYQQVSAAMDHVGSNDHVTMTGPGKRYEFGNWQMPVANSDQDDPKSEPWLEEIFRTTAPNPVLQQPVLSPSDLGGAKALPSDLGLDEETAKARGTYVHNLIEALSLSRTQTITPPTGLSEELVRASSDEASEVTNAANLQWLFTGTSLSEVTVTGRIRNRKVLGVIDRLIIAGDTVTIVDFKTNLAVPRSAETCPEGILRQLGAYCEILKEIYPGKTVETGILWTATREYMSVPQNMVIDALYRSTQLDLEASHS